MAMWGCAVMQLIVQFRPELDVTCSDGLFRGSSPEAVEPVNSILRSFPDAQIEPVFTGDRSSVPAHMQGYYTLNLADANRARALQERLQRQASVEAAYIKPANELP